MLCKFSGLNAASVAASGFLLWGASSWVMADEPCPGGELDECRGLVEINASDGDVGFHVLLDAEGWREARITGPDGSKIFEERAFSALRDQTLTENFFESDEPPCWFEEGNEDVDWDEDEVVTVGEFLERFPAGTYQFRNKLAEGGQIAGSTMLTHTLPAAPIDLDFDGEVISWDYPGPEEADLGQCEVPDGLELAEADDLAGFEVVLEPDDDALSVFKFAIQVPPDVNEVSVPEEYLEALEDLDEEVEIKIEVGAIELRPNGSFGNQTFTELDGCTLEGCEEEEE